MTTQELADASPTETPAAAGADSLPPMPAAATPPSANFDDSTPAGFSLAATEHADAADPLDVDRLLARAGERVTVQGEVAHARVSASGKVFRLFFAGSTEGRALQVVWFPDDGLFDRMADAFGGEAGDDLFGKTVRVTGAVETYNDLPQIVVTDPSQVEVMDN